jgi:hypothetical protein
MLTDFRTVVLPDSENDMSRRYLQVLMRWVPVALQAFNSWPERPHCGHFFGGVYWYGLETAGPSATLALVASSPEFDAALVGCAALELRQMALQGLRYLCLTPRYRPSRVRPPAAQLGTTRTRRHEVGRTRSGIFS